MDWTAPVLTRLDEWLAEHPSTFRDAEPFPHAVIDGVFEQAIMDEVIAEFPPNEDSSWDESHDEGIQIKLRSNWKSDAEIPPVTSELVHFLNYGRFMTWLSALSGIDRLISDPYYTGGGLNSIRRAGVLDVHCDGNWHDKMGVHRRLNAIVYLNRDWDDTWGGDLQLWDRDLTGPVHSIPPRYNRLVAFETHDYSYHGHPEPLQCPEGVSRRSLILYYYTSTPRPADQTMVAEPHRALWRKRSMRPLD